MPYYLLPPFPAQPGVCCSYGDQGRSKVSGFDCVHVPSAATAKADAFPAPSNLCGNNLGLPGGTVCSEYTIEPRLLYASCGQK